MIKSNKQRRGDDSNIHSLKRRLFGLGIKLSNIRREIKATKNHIVKKKLLINKDLLKEAYEKINGMIKSC